MNKRGLVGALSALTLALGAVAGVALSAPAASATDEQPLRKPSGRCATFEVERPTFAEGEQTEQGGATIDLVGGWTRFTTPAVDVTDEDDELEARARWAVNPEDFKLKDLKELKYTTKIDEDGTRGSVAPAVRLVLADGTTLVYEPYWNGTVANGDVKTWTVTDPAAKLWDNGAEPAADETFADWLVKKGDVKVTSVNIGVGTYNEGADVSAKNLVVKYLLDCKPLDIVVTQPACDADEMTVKFTNPNAKVNAWLWVSTDPAGLRWLKPGESWTVTASVDVKFAYLLQKIKYTGKFDVKTFKRQLTFYPGKWIMDVIKFVPSTPCPTTPPTTEPTTGAPTTAPPTTTAPPATTAPVTPEPSVTSTIDPGGDLGGDGPGGLAKTGTATTLIAGGGALLILVGAALFLLTMRRRRTLADTAVMERVS